MYIKHVIRLKLSHKLYTKGIHLLSTIKSFYTCKIFEIKYQRIVTNNTMEKTVLNTPLQNSEGDDRNKTIFEISPKNKNKIKTVEQLNKYFEELKIQSYVDHDEEKSKYFAGKINKIIKTLNIAIVKPCFSDILLYVGTPLFVICTSVGNNKSKYTFLGYIDDIFGSIGEPMYSIAMKCSPTHALNIDEQVYYFSNFPNTLHMYVEHTTDKLSNKRYNIKTKSL